MTRATWRRLALALWVAAAGVGCDRVDVPGPDPAVTETRALASFSAVRADGAARVSVRVGTAQQAVTVTAERDHLSRISTEVRDGVLIIAIRGELQIRRRRPEVAIEVPRLTGAAFAGATQGVVDGLRGGELQLEASGAAQVTATGQVDRLGLRVSGAARAQLADLAARVVEVQGDGAAQGEVQATEALSGALSGAVSLTYSGTVTRIEVTTSGAARVQRR